MGYKILTSHFASLSMFKSDMLLILTMLPDMVFENSLGCESFVAMRTFKTLN